MKRTQLPGLVIGPLMAIVLAAGLGQDVRGATKLDATPLNPAQVEVSPSPDPTSSPSPSPDVTPEPSGSPLPEAHITLGPFHEGVPFRTWAVAVTGGSASVDALEVEDMGSGFSVTVSGQSATVELTLTLPPDRELVADCFDFHNQVSIGVVDPPNRLVLEVVQGGNYRCSYGSEPAGPSGPPSAVVHLFVPAREFDITRPWSISVTGGRAIAFGSGRPISALTLEFETEVSRDALTGFFIVEVVAESATVEMTAPVPLGGGPLLSATCEDTSERPFNALVPPRRLVFDVVPSESYHCDARGRPGTVPPTDTLAGAPAGPSSGGWPAVLVVLAGTLAASLVIVFRAWRDVPENRRGSPDIRIDPKEPTHERHRSER